MVLRFFLLSVFLLASCADGERDNPYDPGSKEYRGWGSSSSSQGIQSSSTALEYGYCVLVSDRICLTGPMSSCPPGGTLSNSCPYGDSNSSSVAPSSSSEAVSSPSTTPSSSSLVPSSSSLTLSSNSVAVSSSNLPPSSSSSSVPSSSSVLPSSSSSPVQSGVVYGTPVTYEGETYQTVKIGTQTWFQRNLNYAVEGSKCGNGSSLSDTNTYTCYNYGRLYNWSTAMALLSSCDSSTCSSQVGAKHRGICPSGWHIPSDAEWTMLTDFVGTNAGTKLKATGYWNDSGGQDTYGFAALPGGFGSSGSFNLVGGYGEWWSASEYSAYSAYYRYMHGNEDVVSYNNFKYNLRSVRCLQD